EQPAGEFVGRRGAPGIGDRTEPFVPHSRERAVRLEPDDARCRARLLTDSYQLTHGAGTLAPARHGTQAAAGVANDVSVRGRGRGPRGRRRGWWPAPARRGI